MSEKSPQSTKKYTNKQLAKELLSLEGKKLAIQDIAKEAKHSLLSIRNSEKQSKNELQKTKKDAIATFSLHHKSVKDTADKVKSDITSTFDEVDGIRRDARDSYNRFKRTYSAALNNERTGILARRDDIADRHAKVKDLHTAIKSLNDEAQAHTKDIEAASISVSENSDEISIIKNRADEIKAEIERTFHLTTDNTMRGALTERKNEINTAMKFWRGVLTLCSIILVTAIAYLVYHQPTGNLVDNLASRFVYITPLLLLIAFAYRQYNHERRILEEYAFKAVMAQTLRNYAVLLSDNYQAADKAPEKILDFLLTSIGSIYDRSVLDNQGGFFYQLIVGNKHIGAQATLQEGTVETQQTKKEEKLISKASVK